jgi:hypothetical protein
MFKSRKGKASSDAVGLVGMTSLMNTANLKPGLTLVQIEELERSAFSKPSVVRKMVL